MISRTILIGIKDNCIGFHVKAALEQGASREEVTEALGMAIYMGAGHAIDAFEQFSKPVNAPASTAA